MLITVDGRIEGKTGLVGRWRSRLQHELALPVLDFTGQADQVPTHAAVPRPVQGRRPHRRHPALPSPAALGGSERGVTLASDACAWGLAAPTPTDPAEGDAAPVIAPEVLAWTRSYPRRPDSVETVATALLAAMSGLGYRRDAERVDVPATTIRGWLQRARANSEIVRVDATMAVHALDPRGWRWRAAPDDVTTRPRACPTPRSDAARRARRRRRDVRRSGWSSAAVPRPRWPHQSGNSVT